MPWRPCEYWTLLLIEGQKPPVTLRSVDIPNDCSSAELLQAVCSELSLSESNIVLKVTFFVFFFQARSQKLNKEEAIPRNLPSLFSSTPFPLPFPYPLRSPPLPSLPLRSRTLPRLRLRVRPPNAFGLSKTRLVTTYLVLFMWSCYMWYHRSSNEEAIACLNVATALFSYIFFIWDELFCFILGKYFRKSSSLHTLAHFFVNL